MAWSVAEMVAVVIACGSRRGGLRLRIPFLVASVGAFLLPALARAEEPQPQPQAQLQPAPPINPLLPLASKHVAREPPAVVEAELAEVEATYPLLEPLVRLPDFLAVDDVLALARSVAEDELRNAIHEQFDRREGETLRGGYLEEPPLDGPDRRTYVLWIHDGHLSQVLALFDARGRLVQRRGFYRAVPRRADLVALGHGQTVDPPRQALIVERITTPSVCCHSIQWDVYRVTDRGRLARIVDIPKSHYDVGPGIQYEYLNHVAFEEDRLVLTRVYPEAHPDVVREPYVFPYRRDRRQFVPSSATARRVAADHRDPHGLEE